MIFFPAMNPSPSLCDAAPRPRRWIMIRSG
jgi:hypothetical protein